MLYDVNKPTKVPVPMIPVNVMIDLETLGRNQDAIVLSIGAVVFTTAGVKGACPTFYVEINPANYEGTVEISTLQFWLKQTASGVPCPAFGTVNVVEAAASLVEFLSEACEYDTSRLVLWANGTDFDIPKLQHLFAQVSADPCWKYNQVRDARTIYKLFGEYGIKPAETLSKHNALADAVWQAQWLGSIMKNLGEFLIIPEFNVSYEEKGSEDGNNSNVSGGVSITPAGDTTSPGVDGETSATTS